jgi:hypothetical protein
MLLYPVENKAEEINNLYINTALWTGIMSAL